MKNRKYNIAIIALISIVIVIVAYIFLFSSKEKITKITLNKNSLILGVGDVEMLEIETSPNDIKNKNVIWESSDINIANVTNNGVVEGINAGSAIITAKTRNGKVFDRCLVEVLDNETIELKFDNPNAQVGINETVQLSVITVPSGLDESIVWKSDNEKVATVDTLGKVTGLQRGKANIIASYNNKNAICEVTVMIPIDSIKFEEDIVSVNINQTKELKVLTSPEKISNNEINWESSNSEIVSVKNGIITGLKEGKARISAKYDGKKVMCNVTVAMPVQNIKLNKTDISLKKGQSEKLVATITPTSVTNESINWTSSNTKIATVDQTGKVTGVGTGTATISATVDGKTATCTVKSIGYIISEDTKFSKYTSVASYSSETLRYSIKKNNGNYVLVWVMDANKQLNSAISQFGKSFSAENLLANEIKRYNYTNKGLVATNASYFWDGWGETPGIPFVINKGNILRDIENINYNRTIYGTLGITKDGNLKAYKFTKDNYASNQTSKKQMLDDGVRNDFAFTLSIVNSDGTVISNGDVNGRTILCQVDENNFVIYSGGSLSFSQIGNELKNTYGCKLAYNLDGGGSRKLYYKTGTMSSAQRIFGGDREIPDMLYFVEQ